MTEGMYLLDNNALSHLSRAQRASRFFFTRCRLPTEVLHEAKGYPDAASIRTIEYPTSASVLKQLGTIMATVHDEDTALVNLYANKGAADPILVACALDATEKSAQYLFAPAWVVVSNDKAVRAKATQFGVESWTREEFLARSQDKWSE